MGRGLETAFYNALTDLLLTDGQTAYAIGKEVRSAADDRIISVPELEESIGMRIIQRRDGVRVQITCSFAHTHTRLQDALLDTSAHRRAETLVEFLANDVPDPAAAYKTLCDRFSTLQSVGFSKEETPVRLDTLRNAQAYNMTRPDGTLSPVLMPGKDAVRAITDGSWRAAYRKDGLYLEFILDYAHTDLQATMNFSKRPTGLRLRIVEN